MANYLLLNDGQLGGLFAMTRLSWCLGVVVCYVFLVRTLRYRRVRSMPRRYGMAQRADFAKMSAEKAQAILKEMTELEFPKFMGFSIVFALFKTYGIPSVSGLLVTTGQLSSKEVASKRIADTGVLLLEFALNPPSSERAIKAIARMNYLHGRYQKAGKISNSDMLYTLSLFALEPMRWVNKYEWRQCTSLELCACGTYWKAMGDAMNISFTELPSHAIGWKDGLHWLDEVREWSLQYEVQHMVPAASNGELVNANLDIVFLNLPPSLNNVGKHLASLFLGERVRKAMLLPRPPTAFAAVINGALVLRQWCLRYLALPRPEFRRKNYISAEPNAGSARFSAKEYLSHPWYVAPTFRRRWGPRAWTTRLLGRKLPGDDGNRYAPEGYLIEEVGPASEKLKGRDEMRAIEKCLEGRGGCPFH